MNGLQDERQRRASAVRHHTLGARTRVAFFGFYGRRNFGDDLFGYLLQSIAADIPEIDMRLIGASPQRELTYRWHLPFVDRLWTRPGIIGACGRFLTYCCALLCSDAAVFGGGTLFGAEASAAFARLIVRWGTWFRKPVYAMGVSVGPFSTDERRMIFGGIVRQISKIAVRDAASVSMVLGMTTRNAPNLGDLAYALPHIYAPQRSAEGARTLVVAIHLREYVDHALAIIAEAEQHDWFDSLVVLSLDEESIPIAEDIARRSMQGRFPCVHIRYEDSILDVVEVIAGATLVVTSKLHGAITSYVYNVPVLLFCYQQKCADFLLDNNLPGPREVMPPVRECVEFAGSQRHAPDGAMFSGSQARFEAFRDFLSAIAIENAKSRKTG